MSELFWSATVLDRRKGEKFRIKATDDEIRVYPVDEDFSLGTWLRFYEFVTKHVDPAATPVVDGGDDA